MACRRYYDSLCVGGDCRTCAYKPHEWTMAAVLNTMLVVVSIITATVIMWMVF
jgi:hypothetical protein